METVNFHVPSISCQVCSNKIQSGLKEMAGIGSTSVDLISKRVDVEYNPQEVSPSDIKKKVASLGYEITL